MLAVLAGSAVNSSGRSASLTAPHGPSQAALMAGTLRHSGTHPWAVAGLQMHANGTALGDSIVSGSACACLGPACLRCALLGPACKQR